MELVGSAAAIACQRCPRADAAIGSIIHNTVAAPPIETGQRPTGLVAQHEGILSRTDKPALVNRSGDKAAILRAIANVAGPVLAIDLEGEDSGTEQEADRTASAAAISHAAEAGTGMHSEVAPADTTGPMLVREVTEEHPA